MSEIYDLDALTRIGVVQVLYYEFAPVHQSMRAETADVRAAVILGMGFARGRRASIIKVEGADAIASITVLLEGDLNPSEISYRVGESKVALTIEGKACWTNSDQLIALIAAAVSLRERLQDVAIDGATGELLRAKINRA